MQKLAGSELGGTVLVSISPSSGFRKRVRHHSLNLKIELTSENAAALAKHAALAGHTSAECRNGAKIRAIWDVSSALTGASAWGEIPGVKTPG